LITYLNDAPELVSYKVAVEQYRETYGVWKLNFNE
jgi:hypothetical protein